MYIPEFNEEKDVSILHAHIKAHPLAAWAAMSNGEIVVNHIPFVLHEKKGELGTLLGHVARANPIWKECSTDLDSVIIFQGSQAYITPGWYPSKHKHGKAVPTWNYIVVHAYGIPRVIEDREWLLAHVNELTGIHERQQELPWKLSDAPDDYIEKLLGAIVGVEIPVARLSGKWKLGQNRPEADKLGMIAGLTSCENAQSYDLAQELSKHVHPNKRG